MIADRCFDAETMYTFLQEVDSLFVPMLSTSVKNHTGLDLKGYAVKLAKKATIAYEKNSNGGISGMIIGYTHDTPDDWSYITQVAVKKSDQKKGIFKKMFIEYEDYVKKLNLKGIWLTTTSLNKAALKAYTHAGFRYVSEEKKKNGIVLIRLEKKLDM